MAALTPQVIDVSLLLPNQTPPKHGGPIGRLTAMVNSQIRHFLPSSQAAPQKVTVEPRDAVSALTAACRDSATGAIVTGDWNNPELLAALGDQLVSICDGIPRVQNGASWTNYGNKRVVTNRLSEDVLHTTNHVLAAADSAYLNGVTCFVWTEISSFVGTGVQQEQTQVGFRGDDGAWVTTPNILFSQIPGATNHALARVVQDGAFFWVFYNFNGGADKIAVRVYDTHGVQVALDFATIPLKWTGTTPGYWDVAAFSNAGVPYVAIVQPDAFTTVGANVQARVWKCTVAGSVITITNTAVGASCNGPLAWSSADATVSSLPYLITVNGTGVVIWELSHAFAIVALYDFGAVLTADPPDSLAGWVEANGAGVIAHVAFSVLSRFSPPAGPPNDPGLRYTRSYACTRAGAVSLTNQVNGVLLSSRAFRIDQDWYAATYYQSGAGTGPAVASEQRTPAEPTDYFAGAPHQPVQVVNGDFTTGAPAVNACDVGYIYPTQEILGPIAHNAGDSAVAVTQVWTLLNAAFTSGAWPASSAVGGFLHISGSAVAANNGDWYVIAVPSATSVITSGISLQGNAMADDTLAGVSAALKQGWPVVIPIGPGGFAGNSQYPDTDMIQKFIGGVATIAGSTGAAVAINGTYSIARIFAAPSTWRGATVLAPSVVYVLLKTSGSSGLAATQYVTGPGAGGGAGTLVVSPLVTNAWDLFGLGTLGSGQTVDAHAGIDMQIVVTGAAHPSNNGTFAETALTSAYGRMASATGAQTDQRAEMFGFGDPIPTVSRDIVDPAKVYMLHVQAFTFDATYIGAILVISSASHHAGINGRYRIISLAPWIDTHAVILDPIDSNVSQTLTNFGFDDGSVALITVTKDASQGSPAYQPCWYLTPLSFSQRVAGRWEWAIAYADWRFDGAAKANAATFERNAYPLALSSVPVGLNGRQLVLPYRAQSFTAGQTIKNQAGSIIGVQSTAESTVGLKQFTFAATPGQAVVNSGEMLLPGAEAGQFSASGFTEDGINLGPEKPFVGVAGGQSFDAGIGAGLRSGGSYQYVEVFEVTSENGDRIWSVTSPPLDVTILAGMNTLIIGGRMPGPTMRVVGIAIYRTALVGGGVGTPTIQHYKITNDLAVNGAGFTFSSVNGGADVDTWAYKDQALDENIVTEDTCLTDKGFLQRFPAPAFRHGVGSWENRSWVIGYDGAVWMSGEKAEGDAIWFHPAFRYTLPTDDKPVALAAMETYLLVFCSRSIWFIPAVQFPDATGANGTLPTPQPLPFRNGCTGHAVTVKAGVAYSSTAGGVWLINRALQNLYLSQPMQDDLEPRTITGLTVDGKQRLVVATGSSDLFVFDELSQAWLKWTLLTAPAALVTTWLKNATIQDTSRVRSVEPANGTFVDDTDGAQTGIAPDITLALTALGTAKGLKRVWAINLTGDIAGGGSDRTFNLRATLSYPDDSDEPPTSFGPYVIDAGSPSNLPINLEINPKIEEATSFVLRVFADFAGVGTLGASYSLELISVEAGIDQTLAKRPVSQRLPGS